MRRIRDLTDDLERGAALYWIAGSLVVLLGMAAFATDLGWILLQNSRLQSAADASALAGVTNLPTFPSGATADAELAAAANGFPTPAEATLSDEILPDNSYRVTLDASVETFFLRLLGFRSIDLSQSAIAQYIKPVRLGSNDNDFGDPADQFWAAINGEYTEIKQGDPYAAKCINDAGGGTPGCNTQTSACTAADLVGQRNSCYRSDGYYYAIDVPAGASGLHLELYDGGHYIDGSGSGTSDPGDTSWRPEWGGVELEYFLYHPDATPSNPTDNNSEACSGIFPVNGPNDEGHFNKWTGNNNCHVPGALAEGIWVLQLPSPLTEGATKFGIRARVDSGQNPKVYGLLDMSLYVNFNGNQAEPYLAEVRPEHQNRDLNVSIWDLGDVDDFAEIWFIDADGNIPNCSWTSSNGESDSGQCRIEITGQRFNEHWLWATIPIPPDYSCDPDPNDDGDTSDSTCWWKLHITSTGQTHDRTTWAAQITGDPVRLTD